jgi:hypothetical protein
MTGLVVSIAMTALGKLQTQKLGLSVGLAIGVALTLAVLATIVLLSADNDEKTNTPARPAARGQVIYTVRWGDVVRDPRTGTRCKATGEGGIPNLFCTHTARGRYEAVFWDDELQVYGPGSKAMTPTYSFKWWPELR